jgi:flagellin
MPRINHNIQSMITATSLRRSERSLSGTLEKLSTGLSINRSADNAAGLSVSEQLRTQIQGLGMANRNVQDGISLLNIAEGALIEMENMLQRMRELAIQSSTATLSDDERNYIQVEVYQLSNEIDRVAASTQFNRMSLLNGDTGNAAHYNPWGDTNAGAYLHIGPNNSFATDLLHVKMKPANCEALGLRDYTNPTAPQILDLSTATSAQDGIGLLDQAINYISTLRSDIGAYTNRLDHALTNQENVLENVTSAESLIRDTDFSFETMNFTRLQILQQASTAMLAQANALPNNILSLLQ